MDARRRHERLQELLLAARELAAEERERFLRASCGEDEELRREIDELLAHDEKPLTIVDAWTGDPPGSGELRAKLAAIWDVEIAAAGPLPRDELLEPLPRSIGKFRILRELGAGGMGVVYEAEQEQPRRVVALKLLRSDLLSSSALRRFEHECELLGRLQHPGIARVYEFGRAETAHGALPYIAMERVAGAPLDEYAKQHGLALRERLELVARVADAVQHAHECGVVHRDLKPENILVEASGAPKILDFGIARAVDGDLRLTSMHTASGQLLGTLAYMSPEQAGGERGAIDARSDVYALGVLLYELLTGRLPHDLSRETLPDAVRVIREVTPRRLRTFSRALRGDLEIIVGKALEKERDRRYFSAADLAADLRRTLRDEPIRAKPPSGLYLLRKLVQRHKTGFVAVAAVFAALVVGLVVSLRFAFAEAEQRRAAEREAYRARLSATVQSLRTGNFAAARAEHERAPEHLRAWEWRHLDRLWARELARIDLPGVIEAAFLDATRILTIGEESSVRVWNAVTGELAPGTASWPTGKRPLALKVTERGRWLLAYTADALYLGDPLAEAPPRIVAFPEVVPAGLPHRAAVAPDGARVAVATESNEVFLFDCSSGEGTRLGDGKAPVRALQFSSSGSMLAVEREGEATVWNAELGELRRSHGGSIAFAPDEATFVLENETMHGAGAGLYWNECSTSKTLRRLSRNDYGAFHFRRSASVRYSPDQRWLAIAYESGAVHLVDADAGAPWPPPPPDRDHARPGGFIGRVEHAGSGELDIAFSADGASLLSLRAGAGTLRVWSTGAVAARPVLRGHEEDIYALACSPDGATIASSGWDNRIRLWDAALQEEIAVLSARGRGRALAFSPDGRQVACGTDHGLVVLDLRTARVAAEPTATVINAVAYSPDGSMLAAAANDSRTFLWNAASFEELRVLDAPSSGATVSVAFDGTGARFATGYASAELRLWEPRTGVELASARFAHGGATSYRGARSLAFSPDGARLAIGWGDAAITLLEVPSLREVAQLLDHRGEVFTLAYSPDGTRIASGGRDGLLRLWEADTGQLLVKLEGHGDYLMALAFDREGRRIATGSGDWTVRLWDSESVRTSWRRHGESAQARPEAERLVARWRAELTSVDAVVARLEEDRDLSPAVRRLALQVVLREEIAKDAPR